jgi:hypothetical protein
MTTPPPAECCEEPRVRRHWLEDPDTCPCICHDDDED